MFVIENAGYGAIMTFSEYNDAYRVFNGEVKRKKARKRPGVNYFVLRGSYKADLLAYLVAFRVDGKHFKIKLKKRKK